MGIARGVLVEWVGSLIPGVPLGTVLGLLAVLALIAATAFFVAVEFSLVAADRNRVESEAAEGSRSAAAVLALLKRLSFHLSGAQLGITVASVALGLIAEPTIAKLIEPGVEAIVGESAAKGVSIVVALTLATVVIMVIGELMPKNLVITRPVAYAKILATPARIYGFVFGPLIKFMNGCADWLTRKVGVEPQEELEHAPSREDLAFVIRSSGEEGTLGPDEVKLLNRAIRFSEKNADDAMIPRVNVHSVEATATVAELVTASADTGLSRFPVTGDDVDDVRGVAHVKAAMRIPVGERASTPVTEIMRTILAVPESRDLVSIVVDMRRRKSQLAVVIDEHGGTAGVLSLEDMLEEIVGEIEDEYDDAAELTVIEDEGIYVLSGSLHRDEVAEASNFDIGDGEYETLGGFVLDVLQRIPAQGEVFRQDGWRLEVVEMDRHRVATVRLNEPRHLVQRRLREQMLARARNGSG